MRRGIITSILVVASIFMLSSAGAQMMGARDMMQNYGKQQQNVQQGQQNYPGMMGGYGYGPHMMQGYGMMHGYGMGPGMMQGYGMGCGMMGDQGFCQGPTHMWNYQSDEYNKFMDETRDTRKKLHDLHFAYGEKMRNPKTTVKELREMEKEMYELKEKLRKKGFEK